MSSDQFSSVEALAEKMFAETPEQPRSEDGKFAPSAPPPEPVAPPVETPASAAPAAPVETPAAPTPAAPVPAPTPEKPKKAIRYKFNHEDHEVDLDAEYERDPTKVSEVWRKGVAFDEVTQKERTRGQREVLDILQQRGYSLIQNATTGEYEIVPPQQQVPTPAAPANVPPPDIDELERRALEGDAEAIVALNRLSRQEASQAKAEIEARKRQEQEFALAQQRKAQQSQYAAYCGNAIDEAVKSLDLGSDPYGQGMAQHFREAAVAQIVAGVPLEKVVMGVTQAGSHFVNARRAALSVATQTGQRQAGAAPPPVVPSASGATAASAQPKRAPTNLEELWDSVASGGR